MNLEQQVCSLDLAKRLKELGVKQGSLFYWVNMKRNGWEIRTPLGARKGIEFALSRISGISAFTVAELGEMLPKNSGNGEYISRWNSNKRWECYMRNRPGCGFEQYADTEADARAQMLIYLLENKLI
jgi:hypothetical protein